MKTAKKRNIWNFLERHRKWITIIAILAICAFVFSPFVLHKDCQSFCEGTSKIEMSLFLSQIVSSIFVSGGVLIAIWQYCVAYRSEMTKLDKERIEKAIKLAEFYKNEVLAYYSIVRYAYEKANIYDLLQKEKHRMVRLDHAELKSIFGESGCKEIASLKLSNEMKNAFFEIVKNVEQSDTDAIMTKNFIMYFNRNFVSRLLNNAEYFAMHFTHGIADESVVFQSLYPTYIEMCRTLYYDIASQSPEGAPKLYRNLQGLYLTWVNKSDEITEKLTQLEDSPGTILEIDWQ